MEAAATATVLVHQQARAAPVREIADVLQEVLTRPLTAYLAGIADTEAVGRWASGEEAVIADRGAEERLRVAYETVLLLLTFDAPRTIRAWFTGLAPDLGDRTPAEAIRAGAFEDVLSAATAFTVNG